MHSLFKECPIMFYSFLDCPKFRIISQMLPPRFLAYFSLFPHEIIVRQILWISGMVLKSSPMSLDAVFLRKLMQILQPNKLNPSFIYTDKAPVVNFP